MKKDILKIAGVKSEKEFYKKFPTKEAFMKVHGKDFKKAAMGASMVKKQLTQLTDFSNPPEAQMGAYIGGDKVGFKPANFNSIYNNLDSTVGLSDQASAMQEKINAKKQEQQKGSGGGGIDAAQMAKFAKMFAKNGKGIPKYQNAGQPIPSAVDSAFGLGTPMDMSGATNPNPYAYQNTNTVPVPQMPYGYGNTTTTSTTKKPDTLAQTSGGLLVDKAVSMAGPFAQPLGKVVKAGREVKQSIQQAAKARQSYGLASLANRASATRPEQTKRRYVRPEDNLVNPGDVAPGFGTGTNFLAKDGMQIGGNLTEIQNMYNPGDMYMDLGYEPLDDSERIKQYRKGGGIPKAVAGASAIALANQIGNAAEFAGDVTSKIIDMGTEKRMKKTYQLLNQTAFQQGMEGVQNQNSAFMEDGGWVSHDWQPQVITQFGGYNLKDLLRDDPTMDTLRSGGSLKESYVPPSEEAMSTDRTNFALGGQLKTHWGGRADVVSYNPYLEDGTGSGESVEFKGKYHSQSAGNGRTGIGMTYYENPVEVENGEPGQKMSEGGSVDDGSFVVFGAKDWSNVFDPELNFPNISGKKIKSRVNSLNDMEKKQNKIMDKSSKEIIDLDPSDPYDAIKFNSFKMKQIGADQKLALIAEDKKTYAAYQEGVLDQWEQNGFHPDLQLDDVLKGKIKYGKDPNMAKFGGKFSQAQTGKKVKDPTTLYDYMVAAGMNPNDSKARQQLAKEAGIKNYTKTATQNQQLLTYLKNKNKDIIPRNFGMPNDAQLAAEVAQFYKDNPQKEIASYDSSANFLRDKSLDRAAAPAFDKYDLSSIGKKRKSLLERGTDLYDSLYPYIKPGIRNPLDPTQLIPEIAALAMNQLEPVQAQTFQPMLEQMPSISFQDQLNEIQADANASKRMVGNNPAALAMIDAQATAAKNKVLGEQFRTNQMMQAETRRRNIGMLNDATLKNFDILDRQYTRGSAAKTATKMQSLTALSSIADKIGKNKADTLEANVMANMYPQFTFGPNGRIYNTGATRFNIPEAGSTTSFGKDAEGNDLLPIYGNTMNDIKGYKVAKSSKKKNGSIVKALKNF